MNVDRSDDICSQLVLHYDNDSVAFYGECKISNDEIFVHSKEDNVIELRCLNDKYLIIVMKVEDDL